MADDTQTTQTSENPVIDRARKRFKLASEADAIRRERALSDLKFREGEGQWSPSLRAIRERDSRPCLTLNVLPARERQILNDMRQNRQSVKVSPVDDGGDQDTAEILQGIFRHIEYDSNADVAYDTAAAFAVRTGGPGYIYVTPEYESPGSKRQVIKIRRVRNPFSVYMDPTCQEADFSDAKWAFRFTTLTKDEFEKEYPNAELSALDDWKGIGERTEGWVEENGVRLAEYFEVVPKDDAEAEVHWYKLNGYEVLDETVIPCPWIGLVPVMGEEMDVDGQLTYEGLVRHTKDAVRMGNYLASGLIEAIATATKSPWLVPAGTVEEFPEWRTANTALHPYMRYKQVDAGGQPAPPPQRISSDVQVSAIASAKAMFADELMQLTGIYQAQLGAKSNEVSGEAIARRKVQGELSSYHYPDNMRRALRHVGRIILSLIPKIYDEKRVIRIIGEDGTHSLVKINQETEYKGVKRVFDLTTGKYDIVFGGGPDYQTRRQEASDNMLQLVKGFPPIMQWAPDLVLKELDFAGSQQLAERAKKTLPPQLQDEQQDIPPQAQAAIAQSQQHLMALNAYAKQLEGEVQKLQQEKQARVVDNQFKQQSDQLKAEVQLAVAEINTKAQILNERLTFVEDLKKQVLAQAHESAMAAQQHQHTLEQGQQQADNAQMQQASDQSFQAQQQAQQVQNGSANNG